MMDPINSAIEQVLTQLGYTKGDSYSDPCMQKFSCKTVVQGCDMFISLLIGSEKSLAILATVFSIGVLKTSCSAVVTVSPLGVLMIDHEHSETR